MAELINPEVQAYADVHTTARPDTSSRWTPPRKRTSPPGG